MPRLKGAKDLKPRKKRKDKVKTRIHFPHNKGNKEFLKLQIWERVPMSREGMSKWNKYIRPKISKHVFMIRMRIDVPIENLVNQKAIENLIVDQVGYSGHFYVFGCSGTLRNSWRVKWVKLAEVVVREVNQELYPHIQNYSRMVHYWFWRGG